MGTPKQPRAENGGRFPYPGIEIRPGKKGGGSIRIYFAIGGAECREVLAGLSPGNANHVKHAHLRRQEILSKIARGTFDYRAEFPQSKRARILTGAAGHMPTVGELLERYLEGERDAVRKGNRSPSTLDGYERTVRYNLMPQWRGVRVDRVSVSAVREWIAALDITRKRVMNILTPLKLALAGAVDDGLIAANPVNSEKLAKTLRDHTRKSTHQYVPFTADERRLILGGCKDAQVRNLFQFAFWSGLRTSELIALRWSDIDLAAGKVRVKGAIVLNVEKGTKTASGVRVVELLPSARAALEAQRAHCQIGFVFLDPRRGLRWGSDKVILWQFKQACGRAGVRYRSAYQARHTYASMMLTAGENIGWLSKQLGHKNIDVTLRVYAQFMPEEATAYQLKGVYRDETPVKLEEARKHV